MTQPTVEQMIEWLRKFCVLDEQPSQSDQQTCFMALAISAHLRVTAGNTLPLDEVPEGWFVAWIGQDVEHFKHLWQCRIQHEDGRTHFAQGTTPAAALRVAIAKTKDVAK